jgi:hypothetical protein
MNGGYMTSEIKPFWQWKEEIRKAEAPWIHPREWYYTAYGKYVAKQRVNNRNKIT